MADIETPPEGADKASDPTIGATVDAVEKAAAKRKVTKKKVVKKKAAKKARATKLVAASPASTPVAAAPPAPAPSALDGEVESLPVWDDDTSEGTLIKLVIQWGPLLLLFLLILVVDGRESGGSAALVPDPAEPSSSTTAAGGAADGNGLPVDAPPSQGVSTSPEPASSPPAIAGGSPGAIPVPETFNPWAVQDFGSEYWGQGGVWNPQDPGLVDPFEGMDLGPEAPWLQDPAAFYWGPGAGQELLLSAPPAPQTE